MALTLAQQNILSVFVSQTIKTRGKNKGHIKSVIDAECFDGRSFKGLVTQGYVDYHQGVAGKGWVATPKALKMFS